MLQQQLYQQQLARKNFIIKEQNKLMKKNKIQKGVKSSN